VVFIVDDDGTEEEFEVLMTFEPDGSERKYILLVPAEEGESGEEEEVYAFRYEEDGDELKLYTIESDEEWDLVEETFRTLMSGTDDSK